MAYTVPRSETPAGRIQDRNDRIRIAAQELCARIKYGTETDPLMAAARFMRRSEHHKRIWLAVASATFTDTYV